jgi:sterol desaturase/sphingolipid hydroxylase (fatty acid hydroxylase superfamily)
MTREIAIVTVFGLLAWLERRRPLRPFVEPMVTRLPRNLALAGLAALTVQAVENPVVRPLAALVEARHLGLVPALGAPPVVTLVVTLVLLDYTLYLWHVLTHRVPLLWRFHLVHHADRDLDASTALRFHLGEIALSVPWRAAQVLVIGVTPAALAAWQTAVLLSILFHHANVRLPLTLERVLNVFVVTPRMHGIHHAAVREYTDSNWSSGLTIWDRLHGTFRGDVPQDAITIGVPAYPRADDVTLANIVALPFVRQRPSWQPPEAV